ncbi:MAG: shikimate dehydrogenase [Chloroflexi bacterium]|nr:shikimate dehydrogenase [Chloroflexota bacterium]
MTTSSKTPLRTAGVIGYPIRHSVSPAMHQAAFKALGLNMAYERWETPPEQLEWRVASLRHAEMLGASVTIPYKERVIPLLDEMDETARTIGAVNTIVSRARRLIGHNTDGPGFLQALREDGGMEPKGKRAVVLGAGGAARAVVVSLLQAGVKELVITNRTAEKADSVAISLASRKQQVVLKPVVWGTPIGDVDLIVNTTSLGMRHGPAEGQGPLAASQIPRHCLVFDLVYNPEETPLLRAAKSAGARTLGGLPMLVYQGALAFELWLGIKPPVDVMLAAAQAALRGR